MTKKSKTAPIPSTVEADPRFTKLVADLCALWNGIAPDAGECSAAEAVELCIDAGRLTMDGYADSDKYVTELIAAHGYEPVEALLVKHTNF